MSVPGLTSSLLNFCMNKHGHSECRGVLQGHTDIKKLFATVVVLNKKDLAEPFNILLCLCPFYLV